MTASLLLHQPRCAKFFAVIFCLFSLTLSPNPATAAVDASTLPAPDAEGNWGYVDAKTGKILIAPRFKAATLFIDDLAIVSTLTPGESATKIGIIDRKGREVLPPMRATVDRASMQSPQGTNIFLRLFVVTDGKKGVFDADRGWIIPAGSCAEVRFTKDEAIYCDDAYYEPDGTRHAPPAGYTIVHAEDATKTFLIRQKKEGIGKAEGIMRWDGSLLVPAEYHNVKSVPQARLWLASRVKSGVAAKVSLVLLAGKIPEVGENVDAVSVDVRDESGNVLRSFSARYHPTTSGETYSYTRKGVDYTVDARSGAAKTKKLDSDPETGFRVFEDGRKYGIKDKSGAVTVQPLYAELYSVGGGLFVGTRKKEYYLDNYGLIDANGKEIVPFVYGSIATSSFPTRTSGPLRVMKWKSGSDPYYRNEYWFMDRAGRLITPQPYHGDMYFNAAGQAAVYRTGKHGVIDHTGKEIVPCVYQSVFDELRLRKKKEGDPEKPVSP